MFEQYGPSAALLGRLTPWRTAAPGRLPSDRIDAARLITTEHGWLIQILMLTRALHWHGMLTGSPEIVISVHVLSGGDQVRTWSCL